MLSVQLEEAFIIYTLEGFSFTSTNMFTIWNEDELARQQPQLVFGFFPPMNFKFSSIQASRLQSSSQVPDWQRCERLVKVCLDQAGRCYVTLSFLVWDLDGYLRLNATDTFKLAKAGWCHECILRQQSHHKAFHIALFNCCSNRTERGFFT